MEVQGSGVGGVEGWTVVGDEGGQVQRFILGPIVYSKDHSGVAWGLFEDHFGANRVETFVESSRL